MKTNVGSPMENDLDRQSLETEKKQKEKNVRLGGILWGTILGAGLLYYVSMEIRHRLDENRRKEELQTFFTTLYSNFNDRKIYLVIAEMTPDVTWANGMEGGYVHGQEGVREYWTRQFTQVSSKVTPVEIIERDGKVNIRVHQVVNDTVGNLQSDTMVTHIFTLREGKIERFDIGQP